MAKIEYRKKENGEIWSCMVPDEQAAAKAAELTAAGCVDIRYPHTLDATIGPSKNRMLGTKKSTEEMIENVYWQRI